MTKLRELKEQIKFEAAKIRSLKQETKDAQRNESLAVSCPLQYQLLIARQSIRYQHIAYCLLRGTEYERIEKPREPLKEKEWDIIRGVQNEYTENVPVSTM